MALSTKSFCIALMIQFSHNVTKYVRIPTFTSITVSYLELELIQETGLSFGIILSKLYPDLIVSSI